MIVYKCILAFVSSTGREYKYGEMISETHYGMIPDAERGNFFPSTQVDGYTRLEAYNKLINWTFSLDINANDFFAWACAHSVEISSGDIDWILDHVQKYGDCGMSACLAYIYNLMPIEPRRTEKFNIALKELQDRNQEVFSDADYSEDYAEGNLRVVKRREVVSTSTTTETTTYNARY